MDILGSTLSSLNEFKEIEFPNWEKILYDIYMFISFA